MSVLFIHHWGWQIKDRFTTLQVKKTGLRGTLSKTDKLINQPMKWKNKSTNKQANHPACEQIVLKLQIQKMEHSSVPVKAVLSIQEMDDD